MRNRDCLITVLVALGWLTCVQAGLAQDQPAQQVTNVYTTHNEHVTVDRTTTTVTETTTTVQPAKRPYKCAIFIENRSDKVPQNKILALQDLMTGYATDRGFKIIAREDALNSAAAMGGPNASGTKDVNVLLLDNNSALRLAQKMGADYLLVCTITSYGTDKQTYRDPAQGIDLVSLKHQMRTTFKLLDVADGGSETAGVAVATLMDRYDPSTGGVERENVIDDLLDASAMDMTTMLAHAASGGQIAKPDNSATTQSTQSQN